MSQGGNSACILLPKGPYCGRSTCCNGRLVYDMGLNIKNDETYRLVDELAKLTGETMTAAVTVAVRERLDRIRRVRDGRLADRLLTIGKDCAARLKEPFKSADHGELLYDDRGLPR